MLVFQINYLKSLWLLVVPRSCISTEDFALNGRRRGSTYPEVVTSMHDNHAIYAKVRGPSNARFISFNDRLFSAARDNKIRAMISTNGILGCG